MFNNLTAQELRSLWVILKAGSLIAEEMKDRYPLGTNMNRQYAAIDTEAWCTAEEVKMREYSIGTM